jgi:outer membrane protein, multidrug efflux system
MLKINLSTITVLIIGLTVMVSCKTLNSSISITEKKLPGTFDNGNTDTNSIAAIHWKQYFADPQLLQLIDSALAGNIDRLVALQRIEIARAGSKLAKAALLPYAQVNVSPAIRRYGLYTMDGAGNISTEITPGKIVPVNLPDYYLGVQSTWEIDVWGKLRSRRSSAIASFLASQEGLHFLQSNIVADVAAAYYQLIALDNELDIIRSTINKQQEAYEVIQMQKNAARANELAVQQFKAQLLGWQAMEYDVLQRITLTENYLNFIAGRFPQPVPRNKQAIFSAPPANISLGIPSQLLQFRPDIREAIHLVQASKFDVKAARAEFFPSLNITAAIGYQAFKPQYLFKTPASLTYTALGSLAAPLVNRNAIKAKFNTAKANQISALYNYQKTILNAYTEVINGLTEIQNLHQTYQLRKEQTEVLASAVQISRDLYTASKASYLEVLLVQQNSLQAQLELVQTCKQRYIATVNIYKALGGGWQ